MPARLALSTLSTPSLSTNNSTSLTRSALAMDIVSSLFAFWVGSLLVRVRKGTALTFFSILRNPLAFDRVLLRPLLGGKGGFPPCAWAAVWIVSLTTSSSSSSSDSSSSVSSSSLSSSSFSVPREKELLLSISTSVSFEAAEKENAIVALLSSTPWCSEATPLRSEATPLRSDATEVELLSVFPVSSSLSSYASVIGVRME